MLWFMPHDCESVAQWRPCTLENLEHLCGYGYCMPAMGSMAFDQCVSAISDSLAGLAPRHPHIDKSLISHLLTTPRNIVGAVS